MPHNGEKSDTDKVAEIFHDLRLLLMGRKRSEVISDLKAVIRKHTQTAPSGGVPTGVRGGTAVLLSDAAVEDVAALGSDGDNPEGGLPGCAVLPDVSHRRGKPIPAVGVRNPGGLSAGAGEL
jgi:hypothetical protein